MKLFSVKEKRLLRAYKERDRSVNCIAFHPGKEHLMAIACADGTVQVWDAKIEDE